MTDKAYIVANEQQEREVLDKLEREGLVWIWGSEATEWLPNQEGFGIIQFPYTLVNTGYYVARCSIDHLADYEIVYDGRKEEQMSEKYVVSQEFMTELEEWKKRGNTEVYFVGSYDLSMSPDYVKRWWNYPEINNFECNNRLIAIIHWVNGEDVFEVEKPKKWVVRSKSLSNSGNYWYVLAREHNMTDWALNEDGATKFDTKEEAEGWANSHQEVIEVEE